MNLRVPHPWCVRVGSYDQSPASLLSVPRHQTTCFPRATIPRHAVTSLSAVPAQTTPANARNAPRIDFARDAQSEKEPTDRCCEFLAELWLQRGAIVEILKQEQRGNHLRVVWNPPSKRAKSQLLVLGHYDTVYPSGTLAKMPIPYSGPKRSGPGTFDMKAGIVQALFALDALRGLRGPSKSAGIFCGPPTKKSAAALPERSSRKKPGAATRYSSWSPRSAHVVL